MTSSACLMLLLASGCGSGRYVNSFCFTESPIRHTAEEIDRLSEAQVRRDLAHNEFGEKHCGWKP
jgi:hypothetical protein